MLNAEAELTMSRTFSVTPGSPLLNGIVASRTKKVRSGYFKALVVLVQKTGAETLKP